MSRKIFRSPIERIDVSPILRIGELPFLNVESVLLTLKMYFFIIYPLIRGDRPMEDGTIEHRRPTLCTAKGKNDNELKLQTDDTDIFCG